MAGIGSLENPYVETNYISGRIVNVRWKNKETIVHSATATYRTDPRILSAFKDLQLHQMRTVSYSGDPFVLPNSSFVVFISVPANAIWSIDVGTEYVPPVEGLPADSTDFRVVQIDNGEIVNTSISISGSGDGPGESAATGGVATGTLTFAVAGYHGAFPFGGVIGTVTVSVAQQLPT